MSDRAKEWLVSIGLVLVVLAAVAVDGWFWSLPWTAATLAGGG